MALKSSAGSEVISFVSKRLLENDLRPQAFPRKSYENVVNPVFVNSWRLLKATSQKYSVVVPSHRNIRVAWDKISEITDLGDKTENSVEIVKIWETLSRPPTATTSIPLQFYLLLGWLITVQKSPSKVVLGFHKKIRNGSNSYRTLKKLGINKCF